MQFHELTRQANKNIEYIRFHGSLWIDLVLLKKRDKDDFVILIFIQYLSYGHVLEPSNDG